MAAVPSTAGQPTPSHVPLVLEASHCSSSQAERPSKRRRLGQMDHQFQQTGLAQHDEPTFASVIGVPTLPLTVRHILDDLRLTTGMPSSQEESNQTTFVVSGLASSHGMHWPRPSPDNTYWPLRETGTGPLLDGLGQHIIPSSTPSSQSPHAFGLGTDMAAFRGSQRTQSGNIGLVSSLSDEEETSLFETQTPIPSHDIERQVSERTIVDTIHEDALDVDDPRRRYGFAEFMDDWRMLHLTGETVPAFRAGPQPNVRLERPSTIIMARDVNSTAPDFQGLKWKSLGPDRATALRMRRVLHPSRRHHVGKVPSDCSLEPPIEPDHEQQLRFRSFHPRHLACPTHFQLRNILTATSRSEIFYSTGNKIMKTSLACPNVRATAMDLSNTALTSTSIRITCISTPERLSFADHADRHILFAGGFCGEYAIVNYASEAPTKQTTGFVSHAWNGIVNHIHSYTNPRSGLLQAAFCSNDRQVRIMDVRTLRFPHTVEYDHAMNCSAMSSDGRLRVFVGDSNQPLITDADDGKVLVKLDGHTDHGFACAWSPSGKVVATGGQDGKTILWDARNWSKPLHTLHAVMSCPRSLHFADDGALVIAESEDVVSVCDTTRLHGRHDIRFFGSIAGVSLLDGGTEFIVANGDHHVGGLFTFRRLSCYELHNDGLSHRRSKTNDTFAEYAAFGVDVFV